MFQYILCVGSRFSLFFCISSLVLFQYILCVGSRGLNQYTKKEQSCFNTSYVSVQEAIGRATAKKQLGFNTSYVSVQAVGFTCNSLVFHVSIHLMCRFKVIDDEEIAQSKLFQYILCVGSSSKDTPYARTMPCFNTSYVSVQGND